MITLLTCHPYMSHGKYRYVVYCERAKYEANYKDNRKKTSETGETETEEGSNVRGTEERGERGESETVDLEPEGYDQTEVPNDALLTETMGSDFSVWFIFIEKILRVVVPVVVMLVVVIWVVIRIMKRKK